ncbi:MAG: four helix bundle protein [Candidatus Margulisiibacteriota bacterium]
MVRSFLDLIVYQNLYKAMIVVITKVVPRLPGEEKYDLGSQMRRACKAPPALIAEGYAQKHHRKEWQKYLNDAIGECNEMIVHLSCAKDVYAGHMDQQLCQELIKIYDISGKQLYRLAESWRERPLPTTHPHNSPHNPNPTLTTHI